MIRSASSTQLNQQEQRLVVATVRINFRGFGSLTIIEIYLVEALRCSASCHRLNEDLFREGTKFAKVLL